MKRTAKWRTDVKGMIHELDNVEEATSAFWRNEIKKDLKKLKLQPLFGPDAPAEETTAEEDDEQMKQLFERDEEERLPGVDFRTEYDEILERILARGGSQKRYRYWVKRYDVRNKKHDYEVAQGRMEVDSQATSGGGREEEEDEGAEMKLGNPTSGRLTHGHQKPIEEYEDPGDEEHKRHYLLASLGDGEWTLLNKNERNLDMLRKLNFYATARKGDSTRYAMAAVPKGVIPNGPKAISMQRVLLQERYDHSEVVHHRDFNGLNNLRSNLEIVSVNVNSAKKRPPGHKDVNMRTYAEEHFDFVKAYKNPKRLLKFPHE